MKLFWFGLVLISKFSIASIFNGDDRKDFYEIKDEKIKKLSKSIPSLIQKRKLVKTSTEYRIKNPSACPKKIKLSYFSDKKLNLFIPHKELSTHTEGDFINFEDRDNQQALISIDNLYGPVAKLKILKKNGKIKETHTLRSLGDGFVWQQTKNKKTQTCIYLDYQTPESDSF